MNPQGRACGFSVRCSAALLCRAAAEQWSAWICHCPGGPLHRTRGCACRMSGRGACADPICCGVQAAYADADSTATALSAVAPVGVTLFELSKLELPSS